MSSDLQGRNAVVFGVANKRSIAWSIAQGLHAAGMKLAITYQNERLEQEDVYKRQTWFRSCAISPCAKDVMLS